MHNHITTELDETTQQYLAEVQREMQQAQMTAAQPFAQRMQGALQLYVRKAGLEGHWELQQDGKTLIRRDAFEKQETTQ